MGTRFHFHGGVIYCRGIFVGESSGFRFGGCGGEDGVSSGLVGGGGSGGADGLPGGLFGFAELGAGSVDCSRSIRTCYVYTKINEFVSYLSRVHHRQR